MRWYYWVIIVLFALLGWWGYSVFYPGKFEPVELTVPEQLVFQRKLTRLDSEAYSEDSASREITFTERELNSVISDDPSLNENVHITLTRGLITVRGIIDVPPGVPVLGERQINFSAGLGLLLEGENPSLILKGVSLGGVPVPSAWLGGVKGENLFDRFDFEQNLVTSGFEEVRVEPGKIIIKLKP